jgi:hypothetical protein
MLGLLTMLTGSEAFSSQRSAAAMVGGRSCARDAGASAKCRSASRRGRVFGVCKTVGSAYVGSNPTPATTVSSQVIEDTANLR